MKKLTNVPVVLTPEEAELLHCYRTMDARRRSENTAMVRRDAEKYPMNRKPVVKAPRGLRLIVGGIS
jgi:hypothetical protein